MFGDDKHSGVFTDVACPLGLQHIDGTADGKLNPAEENELGKRKEERSCQYQTCQAIVPCAFTKPSCRRTKPLPPRYLRTNFESVRKTDADGRPLTNLVVNRCTMSAVADAITEHFMEKCVLQQSVTRQRKCGTGMHLKVLTQGARSDLARSPIHTSTATVMEGQNCAVSAILIAVFSAALVG